MGTNFYAITKRNKCDHCGRSDDETRHIGKSSFGWCFSLHVYPEDGINTLDDWKSYWGREGVVIENEYGNTVPVDEMLATITERSRLKNGNRMGREEMLQNNAEPGPNGLLRHTYRNCIGHGENDGTWDYIVGEFS